MITALVVAFIISMLGGMKSLIIIDDSGVPTGPALMRRANSRPTADLPVLFSNHAHIRETIHRGWIYRP